MTEEEKDELIRKALFKAKPRKRIAKVLGEHVKNILTEEERIRRIKEWDEFYAKEPNTGHMPLELYSLPKAKCNCSESVFDTCEVCWIRKSNEVANKNKDKTRIAMLEFCYPELKDGYDK